MSEPDVERRTLLREIAMTRGATAYFLRQVSLTSDDAFDGPSSLPGWTVAEIIADVAYQARGVANCLEGLAPAIDASAQDRAARVLFGATLSPLALRHVAHHTAVHLNVALRDVLEAGAETGPIALVPGEPLETGQTVRLRTETLWLRSLDLGGLATLRDAPGEVPRRLVASLDDWAHRCEVRIVAVGRLPQDRPVTAGAEAAAHEVRGTLARVGRWAAGRSPAAFDLAPPQRPTDASPRAVALGTGFVNAFAGA